MPVCRRRLATLWFIGSGILFLLLMLQTVLGHYRGDADAAWSWFLPNVMPTLSLIVGVLVIEALGKGSGAKLVDRFLYRLTFVLSVVYLGTIMLSIVLQPFAAISPIELLKQSNLWLAPLQGLVAGSLGAFFVRREAD